MMAAGRKFFRNERSPALDVLGYCVQTPVSDSAIFIELSTRHYESWMGIGVLSTAL